MPFHTLPCAARIPVIPLDTHRNLIVTLVYQARPRPRGILQGQKANFIIPEGTERSNQSLNKARAPVLDDGVDYYDYLAMNRPAEVSFP